MMGPVARTPVSARHWFVKDTYDPRAALLRTLDGHTNGVASVDVTAE